MSPLRGLDPAKRRSFIDGVRRNASAHGHCYGPESEAGLTGSVVSSSVAKYFSDKYSTAKYPNRDERWAAMFEELEIEAFKGVMLHEYGHSLG